jgi:transcriptional regulator with XRE-family HTH domain
VTVRSAFAYPRGFPVARCFSGQRLRDARIAANLRPEQLALIAGRSVFTIHAYERGTIHPPINVLAQVSDVLGRSVDDFLTEEVVEYAV